MKNTAQYFENIKDSLAYLKKKTPFKPSIALILGSGLGDFADELKMRLIIHGPEIPKYPIPSVTGHRGKLVFSRLGPIQILTFQGRLHYYESGDLGAVLYPIHIARGLGIKNLIMTNAAGGINRHFKSGDLMLITDQINLTFRNIESYLYPRRRLNNKFIFPHPPYDPKFVEIIERIAQMSGIHLKRGVYCGVLGPSYETSAEIEMIRRLGSDAVGMSTVNEVSLATRLGMRVAGISCITNMSTGILNQKLSHHEVTEVANSVKHTFSRLLTKIIEGIGSQ